MSNRHLTSDRLHIHLDLDYCLFHQREIHQMVGSSLFPLVRVLNGFEEWEAKLLTEKPDESGMVLIQWEISGKKQYVPLDKVDREELPPRKRKRPDWYASAEANKKSKKTSKRKVKKRMKVK